MCHDLLAKSLPSISRDPRIIGVTPASTASSGFWKQWDYQHHWIISCVTDSNDKNMSTDIFLNPGSASPHSCSILLLLGGWSIVSVLFGFIFVSITCSSMKNNQQIFAAPSQSLCSFVWGPHYVPVLLAGCTSLCALDVLLGQTWWISYEGAYNHDQTLDFFFFSDIDMHCLVLSLPVFGCTCPTCCFDAELPALQFTFFSITWFSNIFIISHCFTS